MEETTAIVSTDRCFLRPATASDYDALVVGIGDPEFPSELPLANLYRQRKLKAWFDSVIQMSVDRRARVFPVDLRTGENCVGQVSLVQRDQSESWNLAFWFRPAYWGKGLASEAATEIVRYAFTVMAIKEIWAGAALWNQRSMDTLLKIGLIPLQEVEASTGASHNAFRAFSVSRDQWMRSASKSSNDST
jgi:RimJ/RimL family protein N-acetyltransferase